ncbi:MAG: DNA-3-methyladenine glycosylase [Capsulimonas sp.]|uniref:DNA-3-methyladenine glycosylase family protein n=1 Tax=Capsulimonas sp. TaxID=2494211 RepID=UPI003265F5A1
MDFTKHNLVCELSFIPPFHWEALLAFFASHATAGVETISHGEYSRTVALSGTHGWFTAALTDSRSSLRIEASPSLSPVFPLLLSHIQQLFDLSADPTVITAALGSLAKGYPGLRIPGGFDPFELTVRAILGQQISVKAATTVAGRFSAAFGKPAAPPIPGLTYYFPDAATVAALTVDQVASLGIIASRTRTIIGVAQAVASGDLSLKPGSDPIETMARMRAIPGIGEWTAQYVAMRALGWADAFPHTDLILCRALGEKNPKGVLALADQWRPWRAYAALHLWANYNSSLGAKL